ALAGDDATAVRGELFEILLQSSPDGIGRDALRIPSRFRTIGILGDDKQRKIAAAGRLSGLFAGAPEIVPFAQPACRKRRPAGLGGCEIHVGFEAAFYFTLAVSGKARPATGLSEPFDSCHAMPLFALCFGIVGVR